MKTLTLDVKKWRCGDEGENKLGKGITRLLNNEGFMCCLGQFSLQLGARKKDILDWSLPASTGVAIPEFIDESGRDSKLAWAAMTINDNKELTTKQRITKLKKLFSKHGFEIKVINQ